MTWTKVENVWNFVHMISKPTVKKFLQIFPSHFLRDREMTGKYLKNFFTVSIEIIPTKILYDLN